MFIDANHEYEYVYNDINNWFPKVKRGGIISGDDYFGENVKRAVDDYFKKTEYKIKTIGQHRGKPRNWYVIK